MAFGTRSGMPYFPEYDEGMYPLIDPVTGRVHQAHLDNLAYPYSSYVSAMPSALDFLIQESKRMDTVNRPMERLFPTESRMTPDQLIKGQAGQTTRNMSSLSKAGSPVSLKKKPYDPLSSLRPSMPQPPRTEVPVDYSESLIKPPSSPQQAARKPVQPKQRPFDYGGTTRNSAPTSLLTDEPEGQASGFSLPSGLLDFDTNFYDDPQRMGLIQAGLGLMSQPRYSTDPSQVSLNQALAGGLAGYLQGYGSTKQRLTQAEKDKLDEEFKRSQMRMDQKYKESLIKQADALVRNYESQILERGKENATLNRNDIINVMTLEGDYTEAELRALPDEDLITRYGKYKDDVYDSKKPPKEPTPTEGERRGAVLESVYNVDPETGERTINEEVLNSPLYRQNFLDYMRTLKTTSSPNGEWTEYEKPQYPVPEGIITKIDLAGPGQRMTDTGRFVRFEGMKSSQREKIDQAYVGINKIQNLQNKLEQYGLPNFMERLLKNDPQTKEIMSDYYDLLLTLKNEGGYNLGVLTGNDEQIMKSVVADPTEMNIRNNFNTIESFLASFNTTKRNLMDNVKPVTSRYNIDPMQEYQQAGFTPLRFDPIQLAPVQQDSMNYDGGALSDELKALQED
jgi:hypothetical protein